MKTWQIFLIGLAGLLALLFLHNYERTIAAIGSIAIVFAVVTGFLAHPRREVFIVRTNSWVANPDDVSLEHNCLAIRVEVARLWLLFIPTFLAVGFLVVTATRGTIWKFSLLDKVGELNPYLFGRVLVLIVWGIISTWVSERWVLRDADAACSPRSVSIDRERVSYSFIDCRGEYYGGEDIAFSLLSSPEVATIVLYNEQKPQENKIAVACMFHRFKIIGHGLTDLDEATIAAHAIPTPAKAASGMRGAKWETSFHSRLTR